MTTTVRIPETAPAAVLAGGPAADAPSWTAHVGGSVPWFLRADALATLIAGIVGFGYLGGSWLALVPLLLVPDIAMVGFVRNARLGSLTYNIGHNLGTAGITVALACGSVWARLPWRAPSSSPISAWTGSLATA